MIAEDDSTAQNAPAWALRLRAQRRQRDWSQRDMVRVLVQAASDNLRQRLPERETILRRIKSYEAGQHQPKDPYRLLYCRAFQMSEAELFSEEADEPGISAAGDHDDEIAMMELARRAMASDVGEATLVHLEQAVDDLAMAYSRTPPQELAARTRRYLGYVARLIDAKKTLTEHRRLLIVGGWLSLLASTCNIDMRRFPVAEAQLDTAAHLSRQADCPEIQAWCLETRAWKSLTDKDFRRALELSQGAGEIAPRGGSAYIQATAQQARAWARLGVGTETRRALSRVEHMASGLPIPDQAEHHYRYDPAKSDAYTATTLAWVGDTAAEPYARSVLTRLEHPQDGPARPRRALAARLDLALALLATDQLDEAAAATTTAMTSGVMVPSHHWRVSEIITSVEARNAPEATELREIFQGLIAS
ncbi:hypothetical protein GCM10009555_040150 [Acrocarpospora macrocephala]|uniref:HTH cro/C1-type domain-containing protein n=1 Tax=Acrocarpospora macrocephala TaxID=150177 RepID=A0A5M3WPG9_9ACTN|nr:transcriptional regulator [Acrocarpospora macrocephala]GES10012.1 hypothetical protein Amac_036090 [Acrocarpospora macrocephala]